MSLTSHACLAAENLFLRKQLALYQKRRTKPRRSDPATRVALVRLSRLRDWRSLLTVVKPRHARPVAPPRVAALLAVEVPARPAADSRRPTAVDHHDGPGKPNVGRIADELRLTLGLAVSPRTIGRALRQLRPPRGGRPAQRWATFVRHHAHAILACDFFTTVTARFRVVYLFVVLGVGTRQIVHWNVTEHPTADWTIQQFRAVITPETAHRFVLHDRDRIYAAEVDRAITSMGRRVLKTPVRTPQANAFGATDRHDAAGVPGLADPSQRATPPLGPSRMGDP